MSTRIDITSDMTRDPAVPHTYELFADFFKPGKVFLYLPFGKFRATHDGVCVEIPVEIWEKIRAFGSEKVRGRWGEED